MTAREHADEPVEAGRGYVEACAGIVLDAQIPYSMILLGGVYGHGEA